MESRPRNPCLARVNRSLRDLGSAVSLEVSPSGGALRQQIKGGSPAAWTVAKKQSGLQDYAVLSEYSEKR
jgi:hypothetical protein